jgi:hypothetical protein
VAGGRGCRHHCGDGRNEADRTGAEHRSTPSDMT